MAPLSSKFSKATNRFEILSWWCFLTSISFNFLRLNIHIVWWCSFIYQQSVHKFATATTTWWSISKSASLKYHTSWIFECHLLSISMWSICESSLYLLSVGAPCPVYNMYLCFIWWLCGTDIKYEHSTTTLVKICCCISLCRLIWQLCFSQLTLTV